MNLLNQKPCQIFFTTPIRKHDFKLNHQPIDFISPSVIRENQTNAPWD